MSKIQVLRRRMRSVRSTQEMTQAMQVVASTKLAQASRIRDHVQALDKKYTELWHLLFDTSAPFESQFLENIDRPSAAEGTVLLLVLGSQKGLCGTYTQSLKRRFLEVYPSLKKENNQVDLLPIGQTVQQFLMQLKLPYSDKYVSLDQTTKQCSVAPLYRFLTDAFLKGAYSKVYLLCHTGPQADPQSVVLHKVLPWSLPASPTNKYLTDLQIILEPDRNTLLKQIFLERLFLDFKKKTIQAYYLEERTRMWAMGQASDNADQLYKELALSYNRTRQQLITRQIIEIASGAEALKQAT